jgi:hypothetical protein
VVVHRDVEQPPRRHELVGDRPVVGDGVGSPLGWLCTRMIAAARSAIASRNTSRGCTSDELRIPA